MKAHKLLSVLVIIGMVFTACAKKGDAAQSAGGGGETR
jgi:hypothetical protein